MPDLHLKNDQFPTPIDRIIRHRAIVLGGLLFAAVAPIPLAIGGWFLFAEQIKAILSSQFWFSIIMMALSLFIIIHLGAAAILAERKFSAYIQDRQGPNRVGYGGLLQPIADGVKFILKEEYIPAAADKPIFILAPCLAFVVALMGFAVIPWAGVIEWPWNGPDGKPAVVSTQVASLDIGVLYMLAVGALGVYGVVLAGWASNNKYAHYGGMRATAQMLSYEVPLGLGILVVIMAAGTLRIENILDVQAQTGVWNVFAHPVAFLLVTIAAFAETNRAPFDLAECEQELIAGFHTEYSSMKFALFFLGEYSHMTTAAALITAVFLGGWAPLPFMDAFGLADNNTWWAALIKFHIFWGKVALFIVFYMVIRWTIPRFRFDQLMRLAWKSLVPLGMAAVIATGILLAFGWRIDAAAGWGTNMTALLIALAANAVIVALSLVVSGNAKRPVTGRQESLPDVA
jgi:NADH-quinone oxidoreductase subunit H